MTILNLTIGLIGLLITGAVSTFGFYKYFTSENKSLRELHQNDVDSIRADYEAKIDTLRKDFEAKIARIYERFDIYKKTIEEKSVSRELCNIMHDNSANAFTKLEVKVDAGFTDMKKEIATLTTRIFENK